MPTGTQNTDGPVQPVPTGIGSPGGSSFWSGNSTLITTDSKTIETNATGAAAAQVKVGLVGPASEAGINIGGLTFYRASATLMATDSDSIRVNADGAAAARVDIGLVGPSSQAAVLLGGDISIYREATNQLHVSSNLRIDSNARVAYGQTYELFLGDLGGNIPGIDFGNLGTTAVYRVATGVFGVGTGAGMTAPTMTGNGLMLKNLAAAPSTDPVGGGILYCEAGALKYRGTGGTVTTLGAA